LASYLRKQGKPTYNESITAEEKTTAEAIEMEKDDLYDKAARIIVKSGQQSISYLQRRLRIGFSRAARLVDMMEMEGIVSPSVGGKAREVLVDRSYFEEVEAQLRLHTCAASVSSPSAFSLSACWRPAARPRLRRRWKSCTP